MRALWLATLLVFGPPSPDATAPESGADEAEAAPAAGFDAEPADAESPATEPTGPTGPTESDSADPVAAPSESAPAEPTSAATFQLAQDIDDGRRRALDTVLPCGLRVITVRDDSLPVAAVVFSLDVGTVDDPVELPGLVHALAFQLLGGTRELRPGQVMADVHDFGGVASMGIGAAQIRFESLVPYAQLDRVLDFEAERLRVPSISKRVWLKLLSYARRDTRPQLPVVKGAWAAAWGDPGLAHDGRQVPKELADVVEGSLGAKMAALFRYERATLVVVGPEAPEDLLAAIEQRMAGLPPATRRVRVTPRPWAQAAPAAPTPLPVPRQKGDTLVWAVPTSPDARTHAEALCGTLNRIPADRGAAKSAKVRCSFFDEPRRPVLVVRGVGQAPVESIQSRLDRIASGEFQALFAKQQARAHSKREDLEARPLSLAIAIAQSDTPASAVPKAQLLEHYTGRAPLPGPAAGPTPGPGSTLAPEIASLYATARAVHLVPEKNKAERGDTPKATAEARP